MKVFISWSGAASHRVAIALRDWLPSVLQNVDPYVSSEDIDKGARWSTDISGELDSSNFGILCITPDNLEAPWLNFEAGALSKSLDRSRVAPLLIGVPRADVQGPVLQFQSTIIEQEDIKKLLQGINASCGDHALEDVRFEEVFEVWWPRLEAKLQKIEGEQDADSGAVPGRPSEAVLAEVLELVRGQQKVLSDPTLLFPPDYVEFIVRGARPVNSSVNDPAVRELISLARNAMNLVRHSNDEVSPAVAESVMLMAPLVDYLDKRSHRERRRVHSDDES